MTSSVLRHTSWLCLTFGLIFCSISPRINHLLSTNINTKESQLMTRHFGMAVLMIGSICWAANADLYKSLDEDGVNSSIAFNGLITMVLIWHSVVIAAFIVEFGWIGAFRQCPLFTRVLAYGGTMMHVFVLVEGLMEIDLANEAFNLTFFINALDLSWHKSRDRIEQFSSVGCLIVGAVWFIFHRQERHNTRNNGIKILKGELVVITGAAGGIGRELALAFAQKGARLALWDIRDEALQQTVQWLSSNGISSNVLQTFVVDVSDANEVVKAAKKLWASEGGKAPRVVVSNAAVMRGLSLLDSTYDEIRLDFSVNVLAGFWVLKTFLQQMIDDKEQSDKNSKKTERVLVTVGSIMAELPAARQSEYCASKAALSQLHECLRWELKKMNHDRRTNNKPFTNIRTLLIQPYAVNTSLISGASLLGEGDTPTERRFALIRKVLPPLDPVDVARRIVEAVQNREERVYIPWIVGWLPLVLNCFPSILRDGILSFCGAFDGTDGFRGCAPLRSGSS